MKKLAVVFVAIGSLAGCVAYPVDRGHHSYPTMTAIATVLANRWDRDRDATATGFAIATYDRRLENPRRY